MYKDTLAKGLTKEGVSEAFLILAGVMQGDTLARYLFTIIVDYIMRQSPEGNTLTFGKVGGTVRRKSVMLTLLPT